LFAFLAHRISARFFVVPLHGEGIMHMKKFWLEVGCFCVDQSSFFIPSVPASFVRPSKSHLPARGMRA
jgi:hypothetical protein